MAYHRIVVEKHTVADPSALGFAAFAATSYIASVHAAGWAPDLAWLGVGLFSGGLIQLLVGMIEFQRNSLFGATAFSTYGALWMAQSVFVILSLANVIPSSLDLPTAFGWFLSAFFVFNSYMVVCASMVNKAIFTTFCFLELTLFTTFISKFTGTNGWIVASGYIGILCAISAFYTSGAFIFNGLAGRQVLFIGTPLLAFDGERTLPASGTHPAADGYEGKDDELEV